MNTNNPHPINLSSSIFPAELGALIEALAGNAHDTWAKGRMATGWTYGPVRDDAMKQHPCLVPYGDLPDSEKEYDRATAISTLKFISKKGYRIMTIVNDETETSK